MSLLPRDKVRTLSDQSQFPCKVPVFTPPRVEFLKKQIKLGLPIPRMYQKWTGVLAVSRDYQPQPPLDPWYIPGAYDDPDEHERLKQLVYTDGCAAVDLGLRWHVLHHPEDAKAVARILESWSTPTPFIIQDDSRLVWSYLWPLFIQAAQLISDSPYYTQDLEDRIKNISLERMALSSAYVQTENRAMWGCLLEVTVGAYLNDRNRFDRAISRWRELFDHDVTDNIPTGEILRESNALFYCNFLLNAMTQVAEIARFNGEWLYDYTSPNGSTYKGLWENVAKWTADPTTFPYWPGSTTVRIQAHVDPLHTLWPNTYSQTLVNTYTTTQDFYGYRQGILAYRGQELYG